MTLLFRKLDWENEYLNFQLEISLLTDVVVPKSGRLVLIVKES